MQMWRLHRTNTFQRAHSHLNADWRWSAANFTPFDKFMCQIRPKIGLRRWRPKHPKTKSNIFFSNRIHRIAATAMAKRDVGPVLAKIRELCLGVSAILSKNFRACFDAQKNSHSWLHKLAIFYKCQDRNFMCFLVCLQRKFTNNLRFEPEQAARTQPQPVLPDGPAHKYV